MIRKCFWTIVRGLGTFCVFVMLGYFKIFKGDWYESEGLTQEFLRDFTNQRMDANIGEGLWIILLHYLLMLGLRSTLENSKFKWLPKDNPFRKWDFSGWKS